ncbi:CxxH/CxxC protein [Carnobacterium sp. CS13]|uniref:CxxH/CxxC protein n=1 Tax=Carnobacterium sp. CS13 TaxID=2800128 RepID=UPI001912082D|nr:CxxH/CxxC protein [Carnobacterium sp. CS13]QQP70312.1 CxxH/CxxC protein [Carnobacterium sp. CS13]
MERIYACQEDVEEALDDAVYGGFEMPILKPVDPVDNVEVKCAYCQSPAIYVVENGYSSTI